METVSGHELDRPDDQGRLRAAVREADIRVLLMVLVHLTGDQTWLEPPFEPARDVRLIPDPGAGLPEAVQERVRSAAIQILSRPDLTPAIADPGNDLLLRMMSVCLGEAVAPEYAPMVREEMSLVSRDPEWPRSRRGVRPRRTVVIIGAGVCGLALGVRLGRLGIPYTILDKNDEVGGTWYGNRYPGAGVDTPNHSYSYSFGPRYPWSRYFSPREEVHDYLDRIATEFGVRPNIRLETRLLRADWVEEDQHWRALVETRNGREVLTADFLVSAIGQLSDPSIPPIPGAEEFAGLIFHSAHWPAGLDLVGKRLAVIGTGATAMQLVPTVADQVADVTVFQRTAQWARPIPGYSEPIGEGAQWLLQHVPFYAEWFRFNMFWRYGDGLLPHLRRDPSWPHKDRSVNRVNDRHRDEMVSLIREELATRQDLVDKCIPPYPPYAKRILLDNGWYRTLLKPNVHLVTDRIERITPDSVRTADGVEHGADVIVLATGFRVTEMAARLGITGRDGLALADAWGNDDPRAFLGLTVPGFPNFFCMLGPNSGPAHGGSVMFQAECQARYITSCLVQLIAGDIGSAEVRQEAVDRYVEAVDAEHEQLIWTHPGVDNYYRNRHGRVFSVMPWRFVDYWAMSHDADLADYVTAPARATEVAAAS